MKRTKAIIVCISIALMFCMCKKEIESLAYLIVQNNSNSGLNVTEVYIRESYTGSSWGTNRLAGNQIRPNNEQTFELAAGTQYDFKLISSGAYNIEKTGVTFNEGRHEQWELTSTGWSSFHWYE